MLLGEAFLERDDPQDFEEPEYLIVGGCRSVAKRLGPQHFRTEEAMSRLLALYSDPDNIHK